MSSSEVLLPGSGQVSPVAILGQASLTQGGCDGSGARYTTAKLSEGAPPSERRLRPRCRSRPSSPPLRLVIHGHFSYACSGPSLIFRTAEIVGQLQRTGRKGSLGSRFSVLLHVEHECVYSASQSCHWPLHLSSHALQIWPIQQLRTDGASQVTVRLTTAKCECAPTLRPLALRHRADIQYEARGSSAQS